MKTSDIQAVDQIAPLRADTKATHDVAGYRAPISEVIKLTDAIGITKGSGWDVVSE